MSTGTERHDVGLIPIFQHEIGELGKRLEKIERIEVSALDKTVSALASVEKALVSLTADILNFEARLEQMEGRLQRLEGKDG